MPTKPMVRLSLIASLLIFPLLYSQTEAPAGLVVERVEEGSAGQIAGIRAGDVLLSWSLGQAHGRLKTPFDIDYAAKEYAPRGTVELAGQRSGAGKSWRLGPGRWEIRTTPRLPTKVQTALEEGRKLVGAGQVEKAVQRFRTAAESEVELKAWILSEGAFLAAGASAWVQADELYESAVAAAGQSPVDTASIYSAWAHMFFNRKQAQEAQKRQEAALTACPDAAPFRLFRAFLLLDAGRFYARARNGPAANRNFQEALKIQETEAPDSVATGETLQVIGGYLNQQGNITEADLITRRALTLQSKIAPGSLDEARAEHTVALMLEDRGELGEAEELYRRSLAVSTQVAPQSSLRGTTLNNLSTLLRDRGDLVEAQQSGEQALSIREKLEPNGLGVADTLTNLSSIAQARGDYVQSEEYLHRSLEIRRRLSPEDIGAELANLGSLERVRGNWDLARDYYQKALEAEKKIGTASNTSIVALYGLANVWKERGNLKKAQDYLRQTLAFATKRFKAGVELASIHNSLGLFYMDDRNFMRAEEQFMLAKGSLERAGTVGVHLAGVEVNLGELAWKRGRFEETERHWHAAERIYEKLAPGSIEFGITLRWLGRAEARKGRKAEAAAYFGRAIDALEAQETKMGGDLETDARLRGDHTEYYREYADLLFSTNQAELAYKTIERSRGRSLLALLVERDLVFSEVPAGLAQQQKLNSEEYDRVLSRIGDLSTDKNEKEIEKLYLELQQLSAERAQLIEHLRQESPRLADLRYPIPLDVDQTRQALDAGTVLISYSVGEQHSTAFVIDAERKPLQAVPIRIGEKQLRLEVEKFRNAIEAHGPQAAADEKRQGRLLYDLLIAPVEGQIEGAERVLLIPDGPLHVLPFAALIRKNGKYVAEWKPLHTALSATIYASLKNQRMNQKEMPGSMAVFADPAYPGFSPEHSPTAQVRAALRGRSTFSPIPSSREEAESIARIYGDRVSLYLGSNATEERAKVIGLNVRYLHFAVHGLLDRRRPLDSALVLSIPAEPAANKENGLLQAWELFEQVRWNADLVVLSACETGLGKEMGGEGLIGMTRAIQYAGGRSVLASLWSVDDRSTAELMARFYTHLHEGKAKDEALQAAQLDLLKSPQSVRPLYWAAFSLNGDPR